VGAERFLVEETRRAKIGVQRLVERLVELLYIDAEVVKHALGNVTVVAGAFDGLRSAVAKDEPAIHSKFIALGVSAEVVVIVENQNARIAAYLLTIKVRGRESADTAANDDEVVRFLGFFRRTERIPMFTVAQLVRKGVGPVVVPTHAGQRGRVIAG